MRCKIRISRTILKSFMRVMRMIYEARNEKFHLIVVVWIEIGGACARFLVS